MKANLRHVSGLTVAELISELEAMPLDARVFFACDYGDYNHTQQALPVDNVAKLTTDDLEESGYSKSGIALRDERDDDESEEREASSAEAQSIVVLR